MLRPYPHGTLNPSVEDPFTDNYEEMCYHPTQPPTLKSDNERVLLLAVVAAAELFHKDWENATNWTLLDQDLKALNKKGKIT